MLSPTLPAGALDYLTKKLALLIPIGKSTKLLGRGDTTLDKK
jgi:hypothetical protein